MIVRNRGSIGLISEPGMFTVQIDGNPGYAEQSFADN